MIVTRQGAGIYFPPSAPRFILAPPRSLKEIHCPCFLSCLPFPRVRKTIFHKKRAGKLPVLLSVVQAKGAVYCTPLHDSCVCTHGLFLMEEKKKKKNEWVSKRPYFHKHTKQNALCPSRSLTSCLLLHSMWARFPPRF